jgi:predicted transposase YbfD/YdcC
MLLPPLGNVAGTQAANIGEHFSELEDPRIDRRKRHLLIDIVVVAICGVICGAETWVDIENFGKAKLKWFKQFLELPNGIPSHDTFGRVFNCLDAEQFQRCFVGWMQAVSDIFKGQVIALDGKTLRRSHDKTIGKAAIHMVSAWALENQLVLGQVKVDEKSNEITAIPKLLEALAIAGCIVTIDALGCQKEIAQQIIDQGADYVLAPLKADPSPILPILEQLKFDESDSVRRSVANNLNDISKDNPGVVVDLLRRWRTHDTAEMRRIINHALRTLVKAGDPDALELLELARQHRS